MSVIGRNSCGQGYKGTLSELNGRGGNALTIYGKSLDLLFIKHCPAINSILNYPYSWLDFSRINHVISLLALLFVYGFFDSWANWKVLMEYLTTMAIERADTRPDGMNFLDLRNL